MRVAYWSNPGVEYSLVPDGGGWYYLAYEGGGARKYITNRGLFELYSCEDENNEYHFKALMESAENYAARSGYNSKELRK